MTNEEPLLIETETIRTWDGVLIRRKTSNKLIMTLRWCIWGWRTGYQVFPGHVNSLQVSSRHTPIRQHAVRHAWWLVSVSL